jgi:hypothetical protein
LTTPTPPRSAPSSLALIHPPIRQAMIGNDSCPHSSVGRSVAAET